jgi:hypothetical protein
MAGHRRNARRLGQLICVNANARRSDIHSALGKDHVLPWERIMTPNVGMIDRVIRVAIGVLLIAFALGLGFPETGWNWLGWIGVVPILTAIFGYCPAYSVVGLSTCPLTHKQT